MGLDHQLSCVEEMNLDMHETLADVGAIQDGLAAGGLFPVDEDMDFESEMELLLQLDLLRRAGTDHGAAGVEGHSTRQRVARSAPPHVTGAGIHGRGISRAKTSGAKTSGAKTSGAKTSGAGRCDRACCPDPHRGHGSERVISCRREGGGCPERGDCVGTTRKRQAGKTGQQTLLLPVTQRPRT